ncbi:hypothetical protein HYH02_012589 [Chlamydomonas schloesseri]|uniref:Uncharacterized protein n=1 Tax=Chlamydomonas schloesseri TaxID=2026947 RepID=A0A835SXA9_9CHLO|nr:hypothetical protein HYH02_012589 [Chlamydomonas schloesseri]|eukprot:KAG2433471.1 hypothetical protein HYH02_012589 [Chlamydomonas schloesseri]
MSTQPTSNGKPILRGVVFDMDGTLLKPVIDFAEMRRRVGVTPEMGDILDVINTWPEERRAQAYATIAEIEEQALKDMSVMPGAPELCAFLDRNGLPRGLITRNVRRSVHYFHEFLGTQPFQPSIQPFQPAITRECEFPYKPSPAALQHIAQSWGVAASEVMMVGDSIKDDIVSGNRAGSLTCYLDNGGGGGPPAHTPDSFSGEQRPTHVVSSLSDLQELIAREYTLVAPPGMEVAAA